MKMLCKKLVVFLLVAMMIGTTCFSGVMAEEKGLETLVAQIEALPSYESFTTPTDIEVNKALDDAEKLIEELAGLSDEDFYGVENSSKVFDLYVGLSIMQLKVGLPTQIPATNEEISQQIQWLYQAKVSQNVLLPELLQYTSLEESDDPNAFGTFGDILYAEYTYELMEVMVRIAAALSTLPEDDQVAFELEVMACVLEQFPETFTVDNFWDYATEFYYTFYDEVTATDIPKFVDLQTAFDQLVMNERDALIAELDKRIVTACDVEAASSASELGLIYFHQIPCDKLWDDIDLLSMLYEEEASLLLTNYALFEEYQAVVYADMFEEWLYGDLDGDYSINAKDALIVLKMAVQKLEITEDALWVGDVDGNGELDAKDALYILKYSVNKIEMFPVEEIYFE